MRKITSILTLMIFCAALTSGLAQGPKTAVIGVNHLTEDGLTFVVLEDLTSSDIIYITDREYNNTTNVFNTGEAVVTFTPGSTISKGTVVFLKEVSSNNLTVTCTGGGACGTASVNGSFSLGSDGDEFYTYGDTDADPTNGVTEIYSVMYTGSSGSPGGTIPALNDPTGDFPSAILIHNFPTSAPNRTEYMFSPASVRDGVSQTNLENPGNYLHAQTNADLSIVEFTNLNLSGANPALQVTRSPGSVVENSGSPITYTFTLSAAAASNTTVNFNVGGTATLTTDYTQSGATTFGASSGTIVINSGLTTASLTMTPVGDTALEPDETVIITATSGTGYDVGSPGSATGTIINDDTINITPSVAVVGTTHTGTEGFSFVALQDIPANSTFYFTENPFNNNTLAFSGSEAVVSWTSPGSLLSRGEVIVATETGTNTFTTTCNSGTCGTVTTVSGNFALANNGEAFFAYTDTDADHTNGVTQVESVLFTGTAVTPGGNIPAIEDPSADYVGAVVVDGFPAVAAGRTEYRFPPERGVTVDQANFQNTANWFHAQAAATLSTVPFANIIISAGSADPTLTLAVSPSSVAEDSGTGMVYTFSLSQAATSDITVNFDVSGTATLTTDYVASGAATFTASSGTAVITNGNSSVSVTLTPVVDTVVEPTETIELMVASGTGYNGGSPNSATGSITNDDTSDSSPLVALMGMSNAGPDGFSFVAARDIPANSVVYFTEDEFDNTTLLFSSGESVLQWTSPAGGQIDQGDVITVTENATPDTFTVACSDTSGNGCGSIAVIEGPFALATNGETIFAYEDNDTDPTNGVVDIFSVMYTGNSFTPGGNLPTTEDPSGIFLNALVVDGFPATAPVKTEYTPASRAVPVTDADFENPANYDHAFSNPPALSTVPFASLDIVDTTPPIISCPGSLINVSVDANCQFALLDYTGFANATDNVDPNPTITQSPAAGTLVGTGITVITLTATDASGNSASCTYDLTVVDTATPTAVCQDTTVQLDASGNATITAADVDGGSTDNCGIASLAVSPSSFTVANVGVNVVTMTVTDTSGNTATCTANVTVEDNVAPTANCIANTSLTVDLDASGNASITAADIDDGSTDASGIASLSVSPNSFDCSNFGENTVTLTVTDNNGNVSTCQTIILVDDPLAPTITCPPSVNRTSSTALVLTALDIGTPTTDDNCGVASVVGTRSDNGSTDLFSDPYQQGVTTITYVVTDNNGLTNTCVQTITISSPPTVNVPNVVNQTQATAESNILGANLTVGAITTANDPVVPAGSVISQNPSGGSSAFEGSPVDLVVSLGPTPGSITVFLSSTPPDGTDFPFTMTRPGQSDATATLDDDTDPTRSNNFTVSLLDAGDFDVSTMVPAGWMIDSIDDGGATTTPITDGVTVSLAQGEDVTLTFNVSEIPTGSITVFLSSTPPDGTDFPFTMTRPGQSDATATIDDDTDPTRSNNFTVSLLNAGDFDVSTMVPAGWMIDSIDDGGATTTPITDGVTVSLAQGEDVTLTFNVSEIPTGSITVFLSSTPPDGTDFPFTMTRPGQSDATATLDDDTDPARSNNFTVSLLNAGDFDVSTMVPAGWMIDSIDDGGATTTPITDGVTVSLAQGEDVTLTFNVKPTPCSVSIDTQTIANPVCEGGQTTVSVEATGTGTLSYVWNANFGSGFIELTHDPSLSTLPISGSTFITDGVQFFAVVTSDNGTPGDDTDDCSITSDVATLSVGTPPPPLQDANLIVCEGEIIDLSSLVTEPGGVFSLNDNPIAPTLDTDGMGGEALMVKYTIASGNVCPDSVGNICILVNAKPPTPNVTDISVSAGGDTEIVPTLPGPVPPAPQPFEVLWDFENQDLAGSTNNVGILPAAALAGSGLENLSFPPGAPDDTGTSYSATSWADTDDNFFEFCMEATSGTFDITGMQVRSYRFPNGPQNYRFEAAINGSGVYNQVGGNFTAFVNFWNGGGLFGPLFSDVTSICVRVIGYNTSDNSETFSVDDFILLGTLNSDPPALSFNFYDADPTSGGANLLAEEVGSYDPLTGPNDSPEVIWVTTVDEGTGCESDPVPVTVEVLGCPDFLPNEDPGIVINSGGGIFLGLDAAFGTSDTTNGSPCALALQNNDGGQPFANFRIPLPLATYGISAGDELFISLDALNNGGVARIEVLQNNQPNTALAANTYTGAGWNTYSTTITVPAGITSIDIWLYSNYLSSSPGTAYYDNLWIQNLTAGGGNVDPIANAGADQTVTDGDNSGDETVTLDGSGSFDPDGTITNYSWSDGTGEIATGETPTVTLPVGTNNLTLTVTDNDGATDTDTVTITVNPGAGNLDPVADAGADQSVADGDGGGTEPVTLDGSGSFDPDGNIVSYVWSIGATNIATGQNPTVVLPVGTTTVTLMVMDNDGATDTDTVDITVVDPTASCPDSLPNEDPSIVLPVGAGFLGLDAAVGTSTTTNGSPCALAIVNNDAGQPFANYRIPIVLANYGINPGDELLISLDALNNGGIARLEVNQDNQPNTALAFNTYSGPGWETFSQTITVPSGISSIDIWIYSNYLSSSPGTTYYDNLIVTNVTGGGGNLDPTAIAGPDQNVVDGDGNGSEDVTLDGSGSFDLDGTIVDYSWSNGSTGVSPTATFPVGTTTVTLTVTDNDGATDTDTVDITVTGPVNLDPIANAGPDQTVIDGDSSGTEDVTLDGSGSFDLDGTIVAYSWSNGATGPNPTATFPVGTTTVTLTVTDDGGATASDTVDITVVDPGAPCPDSLPNEEPSIPLTAEGGFLGIDDISGTSTVTNGSPCALALTNNDVGQPFANYRIPIVLADHGINPGDQLLISLDGNSSQGTARIEVNRNNSPNTALAFNTYVGGWSTFSQVVTVPSGTTSLNIWLYSNYLDSGSGGTAFYDNLIVRNLGPAAVPARFNLNGLNVWPNPATESVSMGFDEPTEVVEFQVFDLLGRLVRTVKVDKNEGEHQMQVYDLPVGTYFIKTTDSRGQQFQEQMVIER